MLFPLVFLCFRWRCPLWANLFFWWCLSCLVFLLAFVLCSALLLVLFCLCLCLVASARLCSVLLALVVVLCLGLRSLLSLRFGCPFLRFLSLALLGCCSSCFALPASFVFLVLGLGSVGRALLGVVFPSLLCLLFVLRSLSLAFFLLWFLVALVSSVPCGFSFLTRLDFFTNV